MPATSPSEIDRQVRAAMEARDLRKAATLALEGFGPDVLRFLHARLFDRTQAEEGYLQFSEDLWVGLPSFRWESNLRTWMFVLARNAATRVSRKQRREIEFNTHHEPRADILDHVRTTTARYMRTEIKDRMREIRSRLDDDSQTILILRVDRGLEWSELAVVMNEVASDAPALELRRASARLRTRFQSAKKKLRAMAEADGLIASRRAREDLE